MFKRGAILWRKMSLPLLGIGVLSYTIYHLVQGDRGIHAWIGLRQELTLKQQELQKLEAEKNRFERDIFLLQDQSLDTELLGEYVRKILHYAPPHDWMIVLPEEPTLP